jgi:hypothetical protein
MPNVPSSAAQAPSISTSPADKPVQSFIASLAEGDETGDTTVSSPNSSSLVDNAYIHNPHSMVFADRKPVSIPACGGIYYKHVNI